MEQGATSSNNPVTCLSKAVQEVQNGSNLASTATKFNIPASILYNRVSDIRRLLKKKKYQEMQASEVTNTQVPDKFGLIINQKLFRCRKLVNSRGIYVDQRYYDALHFVLNGGLIDEAISNYNVDKRVFNEKLRMVEVFKINQSNAGDINLIENKFNTVMEKTFPKLSKCFTIFPIIKKLIEAYSLHFPEEFLTAVSDIEKGANVKEVTEKFAFNMEPFIKVVKNIKFMRCRPSHQIKHKANYIKNLLPNIHASFVDLSLTKSESLAMIQKFYKKKTVRTKWKIEDLEKAFLALEKGMPYSQASSVYGIPQTTLREHAQRRNLFVPQRKRAAHKRKNISQPIAMLAKDEQQLVASPSTKTLIKGKAKVPQLLCLFCHQPGDREEELGKLHVINKVVVHYYCLLFSCALEQNGKDDEGILGFLPKDIMKEIGRGNKLKCVYCGLKGATIGCNNKYCKKAYHFPCGLDNFAQFIFTDNFSSMCVKHRKFQNGPGLGQSMECPICMEMMVVDPKFAIWAPCCKKSSWFHRNCIQKLALSAGYFFKCPLCNDKTTFTSEMLHQGIFVPDQDASWELEPNAFQELLERPIRCDASICKCPAGRKSDEEGTRWEVLLCYLCGSTGIHIACGKLKATTTEWHCPTCIDMLSESAQRTKEETKYKRKCGRKKKRKIYVMDEEDSSLGEMVCVDESESESPSKRRCLFQSVDDSQPSSSKDLPAYGDDELLDCSDDKVISIPKGIRGDTVIKELMMKGDVLSDALCEMKMYAENFPSKLMISKIEEKIFLDTLNQCSSGDLANKCYTVDESHLRKFVECSYNYDQMRLLRKVFELVFFLHSLKIKLSKSNREIQNNPFSRKKRRYKDLSKVKESLVNLLVKAKNANLLDENNTWSSYGNRKKNAYFNNQKEMNVLPSTSHGVSDSTDVDKMESTRFIRVMDDDNLRETCMWCNINLNPGTQPTTIKLSLGTLEVICTFCCTLNVFNNLFPKLHFPTLSPPESNCEEIDNEVIETDTNCTTNTDSTSGKELEPDTISTINTVDTCVMMENGCEMKKLNCNENKKTQSKILNYFTPKLKEQKVSPLLPSTHLSTLKETPKTAEDHSPIYQPPTFMKESLKETSSKISKDFPSKTTKNDGSLKETSSKMSEELPSLTIPCSSKTMKNIESKETSSKLSEELPSLTLPCSSKTMKNIESKETSSKMSEELPSITLPCSSKTMKKENSNKEVSSKISGDLPSSFKDSTVKETSKMPKEIPPPYGEISSTTSKKDNPVKKIPSKVSGDLRQMRINKKVDDGSSLSKKRKLPENNSVSQPQKKSVNLTEEESLSSISKLVENTSKPQIFELAKGEGKLELRSIKPKEQKSERRISPLPTKEKSEPRVFKLVEVSGENKIKIVEELSEPKTKHEDKKNPKLMKLVDSPKPEVLSLNEILPNLKLNKNIENKSGPKSSNLDVINSQFKASSIPPSHPVMSMSFSNKDKICKACEVVEEDKANMKTSNIYCPCCSDVPTFCSKKHFDLWHTLKHNWIVIPPSKGINRPFKQCKVCVKKNFTRYYCPACPGDMGFCSTEHYYVKHPKEISVDQSEEKAANSKESGTSGTSGSQTKPNTSKSIQFPIGPKYSCITNPDFSIVKSKESLKSFRHHRDDDANKTNSTSET